jgi:hypothetical protein
MALPSLRIAHLLAAAAAAADAAISNFKRMDGWMDYLFFFLLFLPLYIYRLRSAGLISRLKNTVG